MPSMKTFQSAAETLPQIPLTAATSYQLQLPEMTTFVDDQLSNTPGILDLIGGNSLQMMSDNHRHHGDFMATIFTLGSYQLLAQTLPWVYRAYHSRRFSYDYFPLELRCWIAAVEKSMPAEQSGAIITIYQWMIAQHETIITLSQQDLAPLPVVDNHWLEHKNSFRAAALRGDHHLCLKIAVDIVKKPEDISPFYLQVLQPTLYEVGTLWEKNKISAAQEHLVSAIVSRVMATANLVISEPVHLHGRVVVSACANEYHELGALMISDILELDSWDVCYLGANVPVADLLEQLRMVKPDVLALSVTMTFNINKAREIIKLMRQEPELAAIKVVVGGKAFSDNRDLWHHIGADACAADLAEARQLLHSFRKAS